ncbi:MAG: peptidoglycan DD-metalloendopeptidase family protein [Pseudomonadota bacterium]
MIAQRFLVLLMCGSLFAALPAHAGKQEDLDNLRKRIKTLQQDMEKTSESKSEAADALRESERAISGLNRNLSELSEKQNDAKRSLQELQQKSGSLDVEIRNQQALLGKMLYRQYVGGRQESLQLMLADRDPNQIARNLHYLEYIARDRQDWIGRLRNNLTQLHEVAEQTRQKSAEIATLQDEQQSHKRKLEKEKQNRQQLLAQYSQQLKQQRQEIDRLKQNEARLSQLVERLAKMLAQSKQQAKAQKPQRAPASGGEPVQNNDKLPDDRFDGAPFERLHGKLALPVKGQLMNRFGMPRPESGIPWKGLFIRTASGQPVKSIAAGRVVFADWMRGFGNLLIVDHGQGYMSLYGNNETLYKQVGDVLKGGETVAAVGNSGGNENSGLYFELRHEGKPVDPLKWVAGK